MRAQGEAEETTKNKDIPMPENSGQAVMDKFEMFEEMAAQPLVDRLERGRG